MSNTGGEEYEVKEAVRERWMEPRKGGREMVIDRKRGQNVWRETWAGGKLMEGETYGERERERRGVQKGAIW